jgi:alpha-beta hydrolase superfamily lysophospholipase
MFLLGTNDKATKLYADLRHGVFMDNDAQVVVKDLLAWFDKKINNNNNNIRRSSY